MNERIDYFFANLDLLLKQGVSPEEALLQTVKDYDYVFFGDDNKTEIARASTVVLRRMNDSED